MTKPASIRTLVRWAIGSKLVNWAVQLIGPELSVKGAEAFVTIANELAAFEMSNRDCCPVHSEQPLSRTECSPGHYILTCPICTADVLDRIAKDPDTITIGPIGDATNPNARVWFDGNGRMHTRASKTEPWKQSISTIRATDHDDTKGEK